MKIRKISPSDLHVGQLLPWDVYGTGGGLLARKGHLIANRTQLDMLAERGVYEDLTEALAEGREQQSVLRLLNGAQLQLEAVLQRIATGNPGDARRKLEEIAGLVTQAVALNPDIAVAAILHNQQAMPYGVRHSVDTAVVAQLVALGLKEPEDDIRIMTLAALTMNVGMLGEHDVMQKQAVPLSEHQRQLIRNHPQAGMVLLRQAGINHEGWLSCVLYHHENEDGTGYPGARRGPYVPESAKLIALADRYCARISLRKYRPPMAPNAALRDILLEGKSTLDSLPAAVLIRELGIYPVGTLVKLQNGEVGVVSRKGLNATAPWVTSVVGLRGAPLDPFPQRDTRNDSHAIREVLLAPQPDVEFRLSQVWGGGALP
ncbi:HD-GYP domain-containing protein [Pseudoduganella ginsengisoli]|uniref:HD-GYP domain-containing protein n=1 Tax=Pseudoduganella ginsengisoli TaxID=1462440 RepID=UPI00353131FB